jgi:clan AA aspartic protease (TIGR02281 family)
MNNETNAARLRYLMQLDANRQKAKSAGRIETQRNEYQTARGGTEAANTTSVPLQKEGGTFVVPAVINNTINLSFVIDSGASDVSIPADIVFELMRKGSIQTSDFIGQKTYELADGSTMPSQTFRLRSVKVGDKVVENVLASMAPVKGSLLLGQSFLSRFRSWSLNNAKQALVLE